MYMVIYVVYIIYHRFIIYLYIYIYIPWIAPIGRSSATALPWAPANAWAPGARPSTCSGPWRERSCAMSRGQVVMGITCDFSILYIYINYLFIYCFFFIYICFYFFIYLRYYILSLWYRMYMMYLISVYVFIYIYIFIWYCDGFSRIMVIRITILDSAGVLS